MVVFVRESDGGVIVIVGGFDVAIEEDKDGDNDSTLELSSIFCFFS